MRHDCGKVPARLRRERGGAFTLTVVPGASMRRNRPVRVLELLDQRLEVAMTYTLARRQFVAGLAASGMAAFGGRPASAAQALPPPLETTRVRFANFIGGICIAPQIVADDLLRGEGFTDVAFVDVPLDKTSAQMIADGEIDFTLDFASAFAIAIDNGLPIKALAGVHVGCFELIGNEGIDSVMDLKGKSVGVGPQLGSDPHVFISAMATYVGLDPVKDINWVLSEITPIELSKQRKIDALLAFPPESQELREKKVGHVVVNSMLDSPWS